MARRPERSAARAQRSRAARAPSAPQHERLGVREVAVLAAGFAALALLVYAPVLSGPFLSDDLHYVATNPYVHDLSFENLLAILDPRSPATVFVVNYAPVHLLLHAVTWQFFGEQTTAYHVINVLLHALGSALLAAVFAQAGLSRLVSASLALLFLLHPANVEAVAWISQAKTPAAFALSMGALLAHPRRPVLGALLFGLALLAKPTAAFALPVAALLDWSRDGRVRTPLAAWALLLGGYAVAELATHQRSGATEAISDDTMVRLRSSFAIAARYFAMAATGFGASAFHEPEPSKSFADPLWLAGAAGIAAIAARSVVAARRRSSELAYWVWAGASFFPISQLFPFLYPMADRYLYFILPGLYGGLLLALRGSAERGARREPKPGDTRTWLSRAALVAALGLAVVFGAQASQRARVWASPVRVLMDSAEHYPNGRTARLVAARRAAQAGDPDAAIAALRRAWELGFNRYEQLDDDPALASLREDPRFRALVREIAGWWVERFSTKADPTQIELRTLALAQLARGERDAALASLERALAAKGPLEAQLRDDIAQVKAMR